MPRVVPRYLKTVFRPDASASGMKLSSMNEGSHVVGEKAMEADVLKSSS